MTEVGGNIKMKKDLIKLIDSQEDIEKLFHKISDSFMPEIEEIHDVQEFQDWLMEIRLELQDIYDRLHDQYVWETINVCGKKMNGTTDRKVFSEIMGRLRAIRKNVGKYYPEEDQKYRIGVGEDVSEKKKPLIFISHSSKNRQQVKLIAELLRGINMQPQQDVFCSSLPGYDIPINTEDRIFDFLRNKFWENDIHVFFIHSVEYYASPVSLNEMGAAWALKSKVTSFLLPGFEFSDMKGVVNGDRIAIKVDNDIIEVKDKLNQLRRSLVAEFTLKNVSDITWEQARDKFIEEINHPKA